MKLINENLVCTIANKAEKGICSGIGNWTPGNMCIQALINYVLGNKDDGDKVTCNDYDLNNLLIEINDNPSWFNDKARAKGIIRLGIAQLGTKGKFNSIKFRKLAAFALYRKFYNKVLKDQHTISAFDDLDIKGIIKFLKLKRRINCMVYDPVDGGDEVRQVLYDLEKGVYVTDFIEKLISNIKGKKKQSDALHEVCDVLADTLKEMGTEGSKYLHLVE